MRQAWLILMFAAPVLVGGCKRVDQGERGEPSSSSPATPPPQLVLPVAEAPLDREALLLATARAASDAAVGGEDGNRQGKLAGRRFELRIRFGCPTGVDGAIEPTEGWMASFEKPRRILRLRVDPDINEGSPLLRETADGAFEEATGFWLPRPWVWTAACPPSPPSEEASDGASSAPAAKPPANSKPQPTPNKASAQPAPPTVVYPRVGIVQGYSADDPRTHRARHAYEVTRRLAADTPPSAAGYDLVIAGRLRRLPGGKVITCRMEQPGRPPTCMIAADFDRVALARGDTGEQIAEWTGTGGI